ncbi:TPA: hypothetical protein N0F65_005543 [Lagenidium giganteum]|uniref:Uncharacterized protein n=1 Tax=Lagenidium giganteum TaxID=4803 RepID=A0AAV2YV44_9STRA|nr:TPA: hypothetical protein N0F65_005543 [Lagenidium giganteum]
MDGNNDGNGKGMPPSNIRQIMRNKKKRRSRRSSSSDKDAKRQKTGETIEELMARSTGSLVEELPRHADVEDEMVKEETRKRGGTDHKQPRSMTGMDASIEWVLDSGSEVNISGDLSLFVHLEDEPPHTLYMANGVEQLVTKRGTVEMEVLNEHTGERELRWLEEPGHRALDYMQTKAGFFMEMSPSQHSCYLTKRSLQLKFVKTQRTYKLWTPARKVSAVLGVSKDSRTVPLAKANARFSHIERTVVEAATFNGAVTGLKVTNKDEFNYVCLPCISAKMTRMSYKRPARRASKPLEKISTDICTVNVATICGSTMFLLVIDEATRKVK